VSELPAEDAQQLAAMAARTMRLQVTIHDGHISITDHHRVIRHGAARAQGARLARRDGSSRPLEPQNVAGCASTVSAAGVVPMKLWVSSVSGIVPAKPTMDAKETMATAIWTRVMRGDLHLVDSSLVGCDESKLRRGHRNLCGVLS
jgi:hypothetical protein